METGQATDVFRQTNLFATVDDDGSLSLWDTEPYMNDTGSFEPVKEHQEPLLQLNPEDGEAFMVGLFGLKPDPGDCIPIRNDANIASEFNNYTEAGEEDGA